MEYSEEEQKYRDKLIKEIEEMRFSIVENPIKLPELKVIQGEG